MTSPDCCGPAPRRASTNTTCLTCGSVGKAVPLITLKALLTPAALATLDPKTEHRFCPEAGCQTVYFSSTRAYSQADVKVAVYQKDIRATTHVCYCFGYTRSDLTRSHREGQAALLPQVIRAHIQAGRCGCEVNNPQGSCCLGNVNGALKALREAHQP